MNRCQNYQRGAVRHRSCRSSGLQQVDQPIHSAPRSACASTMNTRCIRLPWTPLLTEEDLGRPVAILAAFESLLRDVWRQAPFGADYTNRLPFDYVTERLQQVLVGHVDDAEPRTMLALMNLVGSNHLSYEGTDLVLPPALRQRQQTTDVRPLY